MEASEGYVERTQIEEYNSTSLRHSFATHCLKTARICGPNRNSSGIWTFDTQVYTHLARKELQKIHRRFHPKG